MTKIKGLGDIPLDVRSEALHTDDGFNFTKLSTLYHIFISLWGYQPTEIIMTEQQYWAYQKMMNSYEHSLHMDGAIRRELNFRSTSISFK